MSKDKSKLRNRRRVKKCNEDNTDTSLYSLVPSPPPLPDLLDVPMIPGTAIEYPDARRSSPVCNCRSGECFGIMKHYENAESKVVHDFMLENNLYDELRSHKFSVQRTLDYCDVNILQHDSRSCNLQITTSGIRVNRPMPVVNFQQLISLENNEVYNRYHYKGRLIVSVLELKSVTYKCKSNYIHLVTLVPAGTKFHHGFDGIFIIDNTVRILDIEIEALKNQVNRLQSRLDYETGSHHIAEFHYSNN
jgi:hypothetical protein